MKVVTRCRHGHRQRKETASPRGEVESNRKRSGGPEHNVNPIRCERGTSLLGKGEACGRSCERATALSMSQPGCASSLVGLGQADHEGIRWTMRELLGTERCSWPRGPKSHPAAIRAPIVARKRVTIVERRGAGRGNQRRENRCCRQLLPQGYSVGAPSLGRIGAPNVGSSKGR